MPSAPMRPTGRPTLALNEGGSVTGEGGVATVALIAQMRVQHSVVLALSVYELQQPRASCQRQRAAQKGTKRSEGVEGRGVQPADNFPCKSKIGFARASVVGPATEQTSADNSPQTLGVLRVYRYKNIQTNQICRWQPLTVCHLQPSAPSLLCCPRALSLLLSLSIFISIKCILCTFRNRGTSPIQLCFDFVLP